MLGLVDTIERMERRANRWLPSRPVQTNNNTPLWQPNPDREGIPNPQRLALESEADIVGYGGSAGSGKALALYTPIPTPNGWTTMGDIQIGDSIFDEYGLVCQVVATSSVMYGHTCYRIVFSDGSSIVADADHKWLTTTDRERTSALRRTEEARAKRRSIRPTRGIGKRPDLAELNKQRQHNYLHPSNGSIRTTQEIKDTLHTIGKRRAVNHAIKTCSPLQLPEKDLSIDPYILGCWLGDGTSAAAAITTADQEILDSIQVHYRTRRWEEYTYGIYGLKTELRSIGVLSNKHIPKEYLRASISQRIALLQGLMDTDGYCSENGYCEFTTTKENLAVEFLELLGTLGIKSTINQGRATIDGRDCGVKYRILFVTDIPAFRLTRKLNRQKRDGFRGTHSRRYITEVLLIESVPVRCLAVNSPSRLYLAGKSFIPTHNTDLLLGVARTQHTHSVIFRRTSPLLRGIVERSRELYRDGNFNESLHRWSFGNGLIEFEHCQYEQDKERQRGRPRDFYGFDEVTEFTRTQVEFIIGWLRSTKPGQRCRVIMTFNPPTDESGNWVIDYFLPWIAYLFPDEYQHPNPAKPGELRWFTTIDGKEVERPNGEPFEHNGDIIKPMSRTFIPGKLADNPHLANTNYAAVLQALPEPLRSQVLYGDFAARKQADPMQVIPTAWVKAAQKRWMETPRPDIPLSGVGVDVARGGGDKLVISKRYGHWFDEVEAIPGVNVEDGPAAAGKIYDAIQDEKHIGYINIDVIGVGTSAYDSAKTMWPGKVNPVNAAAGSDYVVRAESGETVIKMKNLRAEYYWRMRQALDPIHGDNLALPLGNEIVADLCAAKYKWQAGGVVQIEDKDDIKKRIGRSPDVGEAVLFAHIDIQPQGIKIGGV